MAKPFIINAPREGIAPSPHTGYGNVVNLDIFSVAGVAKLSNLMAKKSGSTVDALVKWIVKSHASPAKIFAIDSNGVVYNSADSGATWAELSDRTGSGQGAIVWKDYLIVATDTGLDTYGPISGSPSWSTGWQTIDSDTLWHPMFVSKNDGKVYIGAGRYVASIEENTGQNFAPGTAGTFTFTAQALDLPEDYRIKCIEELGTILMLGTWQGTNIYDVKKADIFPWDRTSASFNSPISLSEHGVHSLLVMGRKMYVLAGIEGVIYISDGVNVYKAGQIPNSVCDLDGGKYLEWLPCSFINYKGRPFFGVSGGSGAIGGQGLYSLSETSRGNIIVCEHLPSTGNSGATNQMQISALLSVTRDTLLMGWRDNTTYGIDLTTATSRATGYTGFFDTPFYVIGDSLQPRLFNDVEFVLAKALAANEGIRLSFRTDLNDSFTTAVTFDYSTYGALISKNFPNKLDEITAQIKESDLIQFRVSLTGTTTTSHFKYIAFK